MKITKEMEALKSALDVAGENRQWWLETEIFPYIKRFDPWGVSNLCDFFKIEISEFQSWKWLVQMPTDHIKKIRRRVEDRLRKGTPWEVLKVADLLGVKTCIGRFFGISADYVGVTHIEPPNTFFGEPIAGEKKYDFGVEAIDECHAHPFGTSLFVDGRWLWRDAHGELTPLPERFIAETKEGAKCRCKK